MTFAHYDFKRGSSIHEHSHPQEEVYEVIEGELELTIDGATQIARAGLVAIVPSNVLHSVKALTDGRAIIVDYPVRRDFGAWQNALLRTGFPRNLNGTESGKLMVYVQGLRLKGPIPRLWSGHPEAIQIAVHQSGMDCS